MRLQKIKNKKINIIMFVFIYIFMKFMMMISMEYKMAKKFMSELYGVDVYIVFVPVYVKKHGEAYFHMVTYTSKGFLSLKIKIFDYKRIYYGDCLSNGCPYALIKYGKIVFPENG